MKKGSIFRMAALAACLVFLVCLQAVQAQDKGAVTLRLWPGEAPGSTGMTTPETQDFPASAWVAGSPVLILGNVSEPSLTFYPPVIPVDVRGDAGGHPVVVVFPGGGYNILAYDLEGTEVCSWLNRIGVACVLLKYRVPNTGPYPKSEAALQDAQRALGIVRRHASDWKIDTKRVGILGFSAGGHLAAALVSHAASRLYPQVDQADGLSCRPDFQILIYPAYLSDPDGSLELSATIQPPADAPPTFLVQAEDDPVHVENALAYFEVLKKKGVPAEMHLYAHGGHGYGLRAGNAAITTWNTNAARWMESNGFVQK